jgi:hypothetical protein
MVRWPVGQQRLYVETAACAGVPRKLREELVVANLARFHRARQKLKREIQPASTTRSQVTPPQHKREILNRNNPEFQVETTWGSMTEVMSPRKGFV